jgi:glycopeptide antibiotics resistance protein
VSAHRAWRESISEVGAVAGTLPWIWMILTPRPAARELNLVPLRELVGQLAGDPATAVEQIGGNLLVFAAFGFFGTIRWGLRVPRVVAIAAAGSVLVELLQYTLDLGRVSSVDDVLLNAMGAGIAAGVARLTRPVRREYGGRS